MCVFPQAMEGERSEEDEDEILAEMKTKQAELRSIVSQPDNQHRDINCAHIMCIDGV